MFIERNLFDFIVFAEDTLFNALKKISQNKNGYVFSVSETGQLEGVLTDGDFRRWLLATHDSDLQQRVSLASNKNFVCLPATSSHELIEKNFTDLVTFLPLVDQHGHLVAIAQKLPAEFRIGEFLLGDDKPAFIIAEIGINHNGSIELAKRLVDEAIVSGADCVKFQMRSMKNLYKNQGNASDASADLGAQYTLDILSRFQLTTQEMFQVFDYCKGKGILPLCTPWDKDSLAELEAYGLLAYKLASADLTNHELIEAVIHTGKPIIASTGMSSESEIKDAVSIFKKHNAKFVLLHCNSTYPAPFKDINLNYMERLKELANCPVGYSGHERGYAVVIAAVAKGARVIEKHFTLDRGMEGNDHRVSLLPAEFKAMVQSVREVEQALGARDVRRITQGEMMNREVLAKSLIINCELQAGEKITAKMIDIRSPGNGLSPYRKNELIGKYARRAFKAGDFFFPSDIDEGRTEGRNFKFNRPFGIPVRYHDFSKLADKSNLDLLEFHLSYKDMDENPEKFLKNVMDKDVVVHSPDLFAGDHILDLCTPDLAHRRRSIAELKRVVEVAKRIKPFFKRATRPLIILNAGGWTQDAFLPESEREKLHDLVAESLSEIDQSEVEIIPQTMPPFPWHFGGQRYCNIFMFDNDIERFCKKYGYRICLDVSHSALTCNHFGVSFRDFLDRVTGYSAHHHIVDASGSDGEGLQIGEGQIDFGMVADMLNKHAPRSSFIPEIWQGHKNEGEGFWVALNRLEKWL